MLINIIGHITEAALYVLLFGITFSNSLSEICVGIIIGMFVIKRIILKQFTLPKTCINILICALCAITIITFFRSAYFSESIRGSIRIVKFTLLYFAIVDFFQSDEKRIRRTFWVLMTIALISLSNGVFQYIFGTDFLRHKGLIKNDYLRRINASFVHPNDFGAYIIFMIPMTFCFFCRTITKNQRIFLVINCLLGLYCLLKTSSRAAWLGFLIGMMVYFFIYRKQISIIVPIVFILLVALSPSSYERMMNLFALEKNTVWERTQLWKGTWDMVKVHPFLGFGVNTFSQYFPLFKPESYPDLRYTHNSYLQMWSEIGIFGLLAFLSIIATVLKKSLHDIKKKIEKCAEGFILLGLVAGYIAFLIQSGLDTNLFSLRLTTLFWIMTAYMISINKFLER